MLVFTYFEHGGHGLVTKIKPLGGTETVFGYDALLRRVRMTQGALTTYFRHDGIDLLEITTSAGSVTKLTHGYKVIDGIGSVVEVDVDGTRYYLHIDHRGTVYKITDANGDVVWTGLCDAWGKALSEVGSNPSIFWYQGQAWWKLTVNGRLYYVSPARVYDVQDGRFLERDDGTLSGHYTYVDSRPLAAFDPDGRKVQLDIPDTVIVEHTSKEWSDLRKQNPKLARARGYVRIYPWVDVSGELSRWTGYCYIAVKSLGIRGSRKQLEIHYPKAGEVIDGRVITEREIREEILPHEKGHIEISTAIAKYFAAKLTQQRDCCFSRLEWRWYWRLGPWGRGSWEPVLPSAEDCANAGSAIEKKLYDALGGVLGSWNKTLWENMSAGYRAAAEHEAAIAKVKSQFVPMVGVPDWTCADAGGR